MAVSPITSRLAYCDPGYFLALEVFHIRLEALLPVRHSSRITPRSLSISFSWRRIKPDQSCNTSRALSSSPSRAVGTLDKR